MLSSLSVSLCIAVSAHAEDSQRSESSDRDAFLTSVILQAQINVCATRAPRVGKDLVQALEEWRQQNGGALTRGEAVVREEWSVPPSSHEDRLQQLRSLSARFFEVASDDEMAGKCESLLVRDEG